VGVVGGACSDVSQRFLLTSRPEKKGRLVAELRRAPAAKTLVFVRTKFRTHKMAQQLAREGFLCTSIHGDRSQVQGTPQIEKARIFQRFYFYFSLLSLGLLCTPRGLQRDVAYL
jgi:superfamily II DNA/RNA helicase